MPSGQAVALPTVVGRGAGIFPTTGAPGPLGFALRDAGNYVLGLAADPGSRVTATLAYNGSAVGLGNTSSWTATQVSLPAGNYTIDLEGSGRATVAWDFPPGDIETLPLDEPFVGYLVPSGPSLALQVSPPGGGGVSVRLYDAELNLTLSEVIQVRTTIHASAAQAAYVLAVAGTGSGTYALSWSVAPAGSPANPALLFGVGAGVALLLALVAWIVLRGRRR